METAWQFSNSEAVEFVCGCSTAYMLQTLLSIYCQLAAWWNEAGMCDFEGDPVGANWHTRR